METIERPSASMISDLNTMRRQKAGYWIEQTARSLAGMPGRQVNSEQLRLEYAKLLDNLDKYQKDMFAETEKTGRVHEQSLATIYASNAKVRAAIAAANGTITAAQMAGFNKMLDDIDQNQIKYGMDKIDLRNQASWVNDSLDKLKTLVNSSGRPNSPNMNDAIMGQALSDLEKLSVQDPRLIGQYVQEAQGLGIDLPRILVTKSVDGNMANLSATDQKVNQLLVQGAQAQKKAEDFDLQANIDKITIGRNFSRQIGDSVGERGGNDALAAIKLLGPETDRMNSGTQKGDSEPAQKLEPAPDFKTDPKAAQAWVQKINPSLTLDTNGNVMGKTNDGTPISMPYEGFVGVLTHPNASHSEGLWANMDKNRQLYMDEMDRVMHANDPEYVRTRDHIYNSQAFQDAADQRGVDISTDASKHAFLKALMREARATSWAAAANARAQDRANILSGAVNSTPGQRLVASIGQSLAKKHSTTPTQGEQTTADTSITETDAKTLDAGKVGPPTTLKPGSASAVANALVNQQQDKDMAANMKVGVDNADGTPTTKVGPATKLKAPVMTMPDEDFDSKEEGDIPPVDAETGDDKPVEAKPETDSMPSPTYDQQKEQREWKRAGTEPNPGEGDGESDADQPAEGTPGGVLAMPELPTRPQTGVSGQEQAMLGSPDPATRARIQRRIDLLKGLT